MKLHESAVLRIELWHGLILLSSFLLLTPAGIVEPGALFFGGVFMAMNFLLLSYGVQWVLAPFAAKGRIRMGVFFLVLKLILFLGLLSALFFRINVDAVSFAVGVSCLLLAAVAERLWAYRQSAMIR
ncbi:MAG: hypothetical protein ACREP8_13870 [Candidatus Binatia bacterium]